MRSVLLGALLAGILSVAAPHVWAQDRPSKAPDNSAGLDIQLAGDGDIEVGSRLQFVVRTRKRGYLILLLLEPGATVRQIYPMLLNGNLPYGANDQTNALLPGRPATIPDATNVLGNFEIFATSPGPHAVAALLSPVPVQLVALSELPSDGLDLDSTTQSLIAMVRDLRVVPRGRKGTTSELLWSIVVKPYQVR